MAAPVLQLDRLKLMNFRGFARCEIELHPRLTVLVAENGRGKTAILDAIGIALGLFIDAVTGRNDHHSFEREDVRLVPDGDAMSPALPVAFIASGTVATRHLTWQRNVSKPGARMRSTTKQAADLRNAGQVLRTWLDAFAGGHLPSPPSLPLVAFYGTGRLWSEHRRRREKTLALPAHDRFAAYVGCLSSSSSFKEFVAWCKATAAAVRSSPTIGSTSERPALLLAAVESAITVALEPTKWRNPRWDFERESLVVEHEEHGQLPLSSLSDGVRNMIALVADLAHRCVRLNPHLTDRAAAETSGIVLIDEVDMHLHPGWQQQVVGLLQRAFPSMQFVVSTHSPHVLSTVDRTSIRVIHIDGGIGRIETPSFQTLGVESADVLAEVMNVHPEPPVPQADWPRVYRRMIQAGTAGDPDGADLWSRIIEHFGHAHPVVRDLETMQRLEDFRRTHNLGEGG